jgi:uncharacterized protein (TIGR02679 family)
MNLDPLEPLRPVFAQVHAAFEERGAQSAKSITLLETPPDQRRVLADLLGLRTVPETPRVKLSFAQLDVALRESAIGQSLVDVVTAMIGPIVDRRGERARELADRDAMWQHAEGRVGRRPALLRWLVELRAHGRLARAATLTQRPEAAILADTLAVVDQLPAVGVLLPVFALEVLGDAHALDAGRPLAALVLGAAAALTGAPPPANVVERRRLWADVGVACDALSTDVLTFGLLPVGGGMLARHLREASAAGTPRRTTLRELSHERLAVAAGSIVFLCENPSVVAAAADRLGAKTHPLVCLEGVPSTAALRLIQELHESGAEIRFHVDFDWGGVRIGNVLLERLPAARPWRAGAVDYERALAAKRSTVDLAGPPIDARWDTDLRQVMSRHSLAVLEEQVLGDLLGDLAC